MRERAREEPERRRGEELREQQQISVQGSLETLSNTGLDLDLLEKGYKLLSQAGFCRVDRTQKPGL